MYLGTENVLPINKADNRARVYGRLGPGGKFVEYKFVRRPVSIDDEDDASEKDRDIDLKKFGFYTPDKNRFGDKAVWPAGQAVPDPNTAPFDAVYSYLMYGDRSDYPTIADALVALYDQWSGFGEEIWVPLKKPLLFYANIRRSKFNKSTGILTVDNKGSRDGSKNIEADTTYSYVYAIVDGFLYDFDESKPEEDDVLFAMIISPGMTTPVKVQLGKRFQSLTNPQKNKIKKAFNFSGDGQSFTITPRLGLQEARDAGVQIRKGFYLQGQAIAPGFRESFLSYKRIV